MVAYCEGKGFEDWNHTKVGKADVCWLEGEDAQVEVASPSGSKGDITYSQSSLAATTAVCLMEV